MSDAFEFPLDVYLARIGLRELPTPDAAGLDALVRAQLSAIPFENLDVLAGEPVHTDLPAIADKILRRGRGGYCFELNALLAEALRLAGFDFVPFMARVAYGRPQPGPRTHLLMKVTIAGRAWLADAGFGGPTPCGIWPWGHAPAGHDDAQGFRLREADDGEWHLQYREGDCWGGIYHVVPGRASAADIVMANHFVSSWPNSPFRRIFMIRRHASHMDWWIAGRTLVCREHASGVETRQPIDGPEALHALLGAVFGLAVPVEVVQRAWATVLTHEGG